MSFSIAIDGPAGAGKSTIAKSIAKKMGFIYIDTGAMYRTIGLYLSRKGIGPNDQESISKFCHEPQIDLKYENGEQLIFLNHENVSKAIRTEDAGKMASAVAINKQVRERLVCLQREMAMKADVIMDGRDIGTCVLPNANIKIYLTASTEVRARRRYDELIERGMEADLAIIEKDIMNRDYQDMNREISPLCQADDAILLDSSDMTIEEVIQKIISLCE